MPDDTGEIGYAQAMAELEQILAELERDTVDVDVLTARVKRASELIRMCRSRIDATRLEVETIVAGIDPTTDDPAPEEGA